MADTEQQAQSTVKQEESNFTKDNQASINNKEPDNNSQIPSTTQVSKGKQKSEKSPQIFVYGADYSPWVQRVIQVIKIGGYTYTPRSYNPLWSTGHIRKLLNLPPDARVSIPVAIINGKALGDSFIISQEIASLNEEYKKQLFPSEYMEDIEIINKQADTIAAYLRHNFFKYCEKNRQFGKKAFKIGFLGPLAPPLVGYVSNMMLNKYKECDYDKETYLSAVDELTKRLKANGEFLVSDHLTYADIVTTISLPLVHNNHALDFTDEQMEDVNGKDVTDPAKEIAAWAHEIAAKYFK